MNYIDELYRQMIASQGRMPAGDAFDEVLRTGKAPSNFSPIISNDELTPMSSEQARSFYEKNPQLQKNSPEKVSGSSIMPIEYPEGYKVQVPQSEIIRENRNEAILPLMQEAKSIGRNVEDLTRQTDADRNALRQAVQKMRDIDFEKYQNPEIDTLIKSQQEKMLTQGADIPERDMTTELILNLGPALGGMFLGEAGALAAPAAFKQSREIYEGQRKEQIERVKLLKENSEKKLKALIDAKKSGQDAFDKTQERELKKAQYELEGGKALAQQSSQELDKTEQRLLNLNIEIARQRGQGGTDVSKMERGKALDEAKTKRTPRMEKPLKPGEVRGDMDLLPGFTWNKKTPFSQGDLSKLQAAAGDRETINGLLAKVAEKVQNASPIELSNPYSSVRRSIESDLADAQLLYKGEGFANLGVLTGPDVSYLDKVLDPPNFVNAVTRGGPQEAINRYKDAVNRINERFGSKLKFKGFTPNKPMSGLNLPPKKMPPKDITKAPKGMSFEEFKKWKAGE